jgi:transcriptional regulator with XRE-family HTH domain
MDPTPVRKATLVLRAQRRRVVVDDSALANRIGQRLRLARTAARLTQQQLAAGRYSKAYVSSLENGLSKPSMAALSFFAERLGLTAGRLLDDEPTHWRRLEVDLALASGQYEAAIDGYEALLETEAALETRAQLLCGLAEACCKVERAADGVRAGGEAARLFEGLGRPSETATARYWLASGLLQSNNTRDGEAILVDLLAKTRAGLRVEPEFEVRLLVGLASAATYDGRHKMAVSYLEEVRSAAATLDDRRRATYLFDLAYSYRELGDYEAAVRTGIASLALFQATGFEVGIGALENDLALSYLALGNSSRARELAREAEARFERLGSQRWLAHIRETQAQVAIARHELGDAKSLAESALTLAEECGNTKAEVSSLRSLAKIRQAEGDLPGALVFAERAATRARAIGSPGPLREALTSWAELLAEAGEHERAFAVLREAVQT